MKDVQLATFLAVAKVFILDAIDKGDFQGARDMLGQVELVVATKDYSRANAIVHDVKLGSF